MTIETDIVVRLKETGGEAGFPYTVMRDAADEIESLRDIVMRYRQALDFADSEGMEWPDDPIRPDDMQGIWFK